MKYASICVDPPSHSHTRHPPSSPSSPSLSVMAMLSSRISRKVALPPPSLSFSPLLRKRRSQVSTLARSHALVSPSWLLSGPRKEADGPTDGRGADGRMVGRSVGGAIMVVEWSGTWAEGILLRPAPLNNERKSRNRILDFPHAQMILISN